MYGTVRYGTDRLRKEGFEGGDGSVVCCEIPTSHYILSGSMLFPVDPSILRRPLVCARTHRIVIPNRQLTACTALTKTDEPKAPRQKL